MCKIFFLFIFIVMFEGFFGGKCIYKLIIIKIFSYMLGNL